MQQVAPVRQFENLVYQQHLATSLIELASKLRQAVRLEEEAVHVDIKASRILWREVLFGILQQESCLSHSTAALDANKTIAPIYFIH
jgi:hypothetical protein